MGGNNCSKQENWKPDEQAESCEGCREPFSFTRRRHHCRNCGGIFCNNCSEKRATIPDLKDQDPVRVCDSCCKALSKPTKSGNHKEQNAPPSLPPIVPEEISVVPQPKPITLHPPMPPTNATVDYEKTVESATSAFVDIEQCQTIPPSSLELTGLDGDLIPDLEVYDGSALYALPETATPDLNDFLQQPVSEVPQVVQAIHLEWLPCLMDDCEFTESADQFSPPSSR